MVRPEYPIRDKRGQYIGLQYGHPTGRRLALDLNFGLGCSDCYAFLWLHGLDDDALASVDINYGFDSYSYSWALHSPFHTSPARVLQ